MARPVTDYEIEQLLERTPLEVKPILIRLLSERRELIDTRAERMYISELDTDWSDG